MKKLFLFLLLTTVVLCVGCSSDDNEKEDIPTLTQELLEQGNGLWCTESLGADYAEIKFKEGEMKYASLNNVYGRKGTYEIKSSSCLVYHDTDYDKDYNVIVWIDKKEGRVSLYISSNSDNPLPSRFTTGKYVKCTRPVIYK